MSSQNPFQNSTQGPIEFLMKPAANRSETLLDALWLFFLIAASSVWCVTAAHSLSATFDEPTYLQAGLDCWRGGTYKPLMRLGTMPLAIDVQTLPLYVWERMHGTRIDLVRDIDWILTWARAGTLVFWGILLVYVFRTAKSIAGSWAGRIAAALVAVEPALLGHASLATTDIAAAAGILAFAFEFHAGRGLGWWRRLGLPSVLYGLAILAKASALVFAPVAMIVIEFDRLLRSEGFAQTTGKALVERGKFLCGRLWEFRKDFFSVIGLGLLVTFLYCRSDWTTEPTFVKWAQGLKPGRSHDIMLWLSEHLRIFTNAGEGLAQQIKHNMRGHATYILGQERRRAVWWYFPVATTIKCSIPFLVLPLAIAAVRGRALRNWPCLVAGALFLYSVTCRVQLGIRFMFPLMALAAAGYGAAVVVAWRETEKPWKRKALGVFVAAGILYTGLASALVWPEALCYTNEFWGGTADGYKLLSDSNYDWGQGLKELVKWREAHGVDAVDVWYFGDPRMDISPLRKFPLHEPSFTQNKTMDELMQGRCVAVSTTMLYGSYFPDAGGAVRTFLKGRPPASRTTTYLIYDFR